MSSQTAPITSTSPLVTLNIRGHATVRRRAEFVRVTANILFESSDNNEHLPGIVEWWNGPVINTDSRLVHPAEMPWAPRITRMYRGTTSLRVLFRSFRQMCSFMDAYRGEVCISFATPVWEVGPNSRAYLCSAATQAAYQDARAQAEAYAVALDVLGSPSTTPTTDSGFALTELSQVPLQRVIRSIDIMQQDAPMFKSTAGNGGQRQHDGGPATSSRDGSDL
ncbi:hypothetical protein ISF_01849 [Cordyceps fumosorosea ARSEF 2679]|uniref:Uncharacterized protein n=1 Tax=Cordyceps fumosorosea (strain ARSEF 2679) TaxID=1081104 RepID=A0A168CF17_CORFA|nr:hypothetical protein ISF_01849 [Cordyceps fumosorosea ARSEF 2679]OAA71298.1 hypothetical protein ISF_01849 [Cordyceps fumosorosea ARSEF 2679]